MKEQGILNSLIAKFPGVINSRYPFPSPFIGNGKIKAIVLGADPTHIVNEKPKQLDKVFGLDKPKSPYWRSIQGNLDGLILSMDNIYVQNLCRNYFTKETSKNKYWKQIARDYWAPFLKKELDERFDTNVPVLMTTEFILHSVLTDPKRKLEAKTIYKEKIVIPKEENLLGRDLIAFYRHYKYSLTLPKWKGYKEFISARVYSNGRL